MIEARTACLCSYWKWKNASFYYTDLTYAKSELCYLQIVNWSYNESNTN